MPITPIALASRSNPSRYGYEGAATIINGFAEDLGQEGKNSFAVYARSGLQTFSTLSSSPGGVRASIDLGNTLYVVCGYNLFSVDVNGNSTNLGNINTSGAVTMARNSNATPQIAIVTNFQWWIVHGGVLTPAPSANLPPPNSVCGMDGYFIFTIPDGRFFVSSINDGTTISALSFATAETSPYGLVRGARRGTDLVLLGPRATEFWQDTGGSPFPFSRTATIDVGCYAAGSVTEVLALKDGQPLIDTLAWAAADRQGTYAGVVMLTGYSAVKISIKAVDRAIAADPSPGNISSHSWTENGHHFYCISGTNYSWVYDFSSGAWNPYTSYGLTRYIGSTHAQFAGQQLVGDYANPILYTMSPTIYTDNGNPIVWTNQLPVVHAFPKRLQVDAIFLDIVPGVGLVTGASQDVTPMLMLDYSQDGGRSWGPQRQLHVGVQGHSLIRVSDRVFGIMDTNGVTFRISMSADVVKGIVGAALDATPMNL